jgi:hypothetical protein
LRDDHTTCEDVSTAPVCKCNQPANRTEQQPFIVEMALANDQATGAANSTAAQAVALPLADPSSFPIESVTTVGERPA